MFIRIQGFSAAAHVSTFLPFFVLNCGGISGFPAVCCRFFVLALPGFPAVLSIVKMHKSVVDHFSGKRTRYIASLQFTTGLLGKHTCRPPRETPAPRYSVHLPACCAPTMRHLFQIIH